MTTSEDRQNEVSGKPEGPRGFGDFFLAIPWQWYLVLGGAGYLILHTFAGRQIPLPDQSPDEAALYAHRLVWRTAAVIFQYLLPAAFGLGAVFSFRHAAKRKRMARKGD